MRCLPAKVLRRASLRVCTLIWRMTDWNQTLSTVGIACNSIRTSSVLLL